MEKFRVELEKTLFRSKFQTIGYLRTNVVYNLVGRFYFVVSLVKKFPSQLLKFVQILILILDIIDIRAGYVIFFFECCPNLTAYILELLI
jgi:hypothetical protein